MQGRGQYNLSGPVVAQLPRPVRTPSRPVKTPNSTRYQHFLDGQETTPMPVAVDAYEMTTSIVKEFKSNSWIIPDHPRRGRRRKAMYRVLNQTPARKQHTRELHMRGMRENLGFRRTKALVNSMKTGRWIKEGWTWKLHTPVITPDRVDRHCTACHKDRFLKHWWATKAEPTTYLCNACFANDFDLMVPEGRPEKLPAVFTSAHLPLPPSLKPSS